MKHLYSSGFLLLLLLLSAVTKAQIRYASSVVAFSSEYSATGWGAIQTLGVPNTQGCGDISSAWASRTSDGAREFLELEFPDPAPINRIFIHETLSPGAIDTVYVLNPATQIYEKVYEATAVAGAPCPRAFAINFPLTTFPVSRIRIAINSPVVSGYNEIDAVGIANYSSDGIISGSQNVCASAAAAAFVSDNPAFDGAPGVVYQWQDSTAGGSWQDIAGAAALTYQPLIVTQDTWYRRKATLATATGYSNILKLTYRESGDPAVIPQGSWNFYAYQANSLDLGNAIYKGMYSRATIDFNTGDHWSSISTPSAASGYIGCVVPDNQFVLVAKRKGFPAGNYKLVNLFSALLRVYINGSIVAQPACCNSTVYLGALDDNSVVELRLLDSYSSAYLQVEFQVAELSGGDIGESQALCVNEIPALFVNNIAANGGAAPASITYQWQDSVATGNWKNIPSATAATYQAGTISDTTWFRRKATDNTNAVAYSDVLRLTAAVVKGDTSVYGNQQWNIYGFNGNQISLAGTSYRGFYTAAGNSIDTYLQFGIFGSPSDAPGYQGCPVNNETFIMSARRTGFAGGRYRLDITNVDDEMMVLLDGVEKYRGGCCINLDLGALNASSKLEVRLREGGYISRLIMDLLRIDSSISEYQNTNCNFYSQTGVTGDQWFDLTDASGKMIVSINPGSNNLGTMFMYAKHYGVGTASIPRTPLNNKRYMPRYWRLFSSNYSSGNFPSPVKVRLYFKNSEFEDYKTLTNQPSLTLDELKITHYSGNGEDCDFANNANQGVMVNPVQVKEFTTEGFYVEVSISHFSEFGSVGGSEILPVKLTQFRAVSAGEAVQLNWATAQELNNKGFEILRSKDGVQFEKIGWVDGNGTTSTAQRYTFKDNAPFAGRNFYRLRQLDIDNTPALSDIVAVTMKKAISLSIAPNPVDNTLYIEFDEKNTTSVRILDLQGRVQWKSNGQSTSSLLTVPVQHLTKGIYMVEVTDKQGNRQVERFIKK